MTPIWREDGQRALLGSVAVPGTLHQACYGDRPAISGFRESVD